MEWRENTSRLHTFIKNVSTTSPGISFPKPAWMKFNRLRTNIGLFRLETHKWGMASTAACKCGAKEQTAEHVITSCPICHHPNGAHAFSDIDQSLVDWWKHVQPLSRPSSSRLSPPNEKEEDYVLDIKIKKFEADSKWRPFIFFKYFLGNTTFRKRKSRNSRQI